MSEKRFIVESVIITKDCNEDKSRIVKVITDKEELYSYDDLYEISYLLNELSDENRQLKEENEQLQKQVDNLQDALAEICATLILEGIEIEFDGKNLSELINI